MSIKDPNPYKIFSALWSQPASTLDQLKTAIPMELPTLKHHMKKLVDSKVVQTEEIEE